MPIKSLKPRLCVYIPNPDYFDKLRSRLRDLWYETYGMHPNKGEILQLALEYSIKNLEDNIEIFNDDIRKKYSRLD